MRTKWRVAAGALAVVMVMAAPPAVTAAPPGAGPVAGGRSLTVTLVTGDRVVLAAGGDRVVAIRPAKGREKVRFGAWAAGDALYVIPADAEPLLGARRLDRRLFDVRGLVEGGYHDAARDTLPLIVTYTGGAARTGGQAVATAGARVTRDLPAIGGGAVTVQKGQGAGWWSAIAGGAATLRTGVERIWLDAKRQPTLDRSVPRIGAPTAWQAGFTGKGVTVAVLDSGVDATHPDLAGKVSDARNFTEEPDATDDVGHGTHVASTVAGTGAASGGRYRGVAPDATLVSGKVCGRSGCWDSEIVAGMQWAAAEKKATVVNLSLGGTDTPETDPVEAAVDALTAAHGTLFVVSAGNRGPADGTVASPGSAAAALTVGAVDRSDALARFSSRGPREGDGGLKPDITAPGVDIVAARATGTEMGTVVDDSYTMESGTSMAAPHVTGAVALLAQRHPDWTAGRLKATLMGAAKPVPGQTGYQQGAGRVDVARAITQAVTTDPASVSYGRTTWPHTDDEPVARPVTYHNGGSAPVTLDLAVRAVGPGGTAAPAGMFTSSADRLTVPAGGSAQATVTVDTRVAGADGLYSGHLIATGGDVAVSTPLAVHKELPTYELTIRHIDATGAPAATAFATIVYGLDNEEDDIHYDEDGDGSVTLRLPRGRYGALSHIGEGESSRYTMVAWPSLDLTADRTVVLDARQGKPVAMTVPESSARPVSEQIWYAHYSSDPYGPSAHGTNFTFYIPLEDLYTAQLGDPVPQDWVRAYVTSQFAKPDGEGGFAGTPFLYAVGDLTEGRLPTGLTRHYTARDLATTHHRFRATGPEQVAERVVAIQFGATSFLPVSLPSERMEYYNDEAEVAGTELHVSDGSILYSTRASYWYRPGQAAREEWNAGPFGPSLAGPYYPWEWVTRTGDVISADVPLFGDRDGHPGFSAYDTARVALYRDGALVRESARPGDRFVVPEEPGAYRLEASVTRGGELSTQVGGVWTFPSRHVDGETPAKLPVQVVRFTPTLDEKGGAPAGHRFEIPVTVGRQPGAPAAAVKRITVEISYDDGRTWRRVPLRPTRDGWSATVTHPAGAGFASLRASATDTAGGTVTQTVIHAYRLTPPA